MGYTHYWEGPAFEAKAWDKLTEATKRVFGYAKDKGIVLADGYGDINTMPEANDDLIRFNGSGDDAHETCAIQRNGTKFDFCKTAYKPYDTVVTAVLILAHHFNEEFKPTSDGDATDWQAGYELASQATGINSLTIPEGV